MHDTNSAINKPFISKEKETERNNVYYCRYCRKQYKSLKTVKNHQESHKYKYGCKLCLKRFQTVEAMEQHETKKHRSKGKIKKCRICPDTILLTEEDYLFHINEVHKGKQVDYYMCSDCGKQFKTKSELSSHITSKCGTIKQFKCQVCDQELMTAGSLHNHMLRHNGEPNFMCRFCAKLFLTAGQLKVHERIHTQDKAFVCQICGKGFCHRQSLITHSTLHTGIKPYQCENCGNSFSCVGNLLKHRKTHADSCGLVPLTTHRVNHPSTRMKVKVNTPANSKLKQMKMEKELQEKLNALKEKKLEETQKSDVEPTSGNNKENYTNKQEIKNIRSVTNYDGFDDEDGSNVECVSLDHDDDTESVIHGNDIYLIDTVPDDRNIEHKDSVPTNSQANADSTKMQFKADKEQSSEMSNNGENISILESYKNANKLKCGKNDLDSDNSKDLTTGMLNQCDSKDTEKESHKETSTNNLANEKRRIKSVKTDISKRISVKIKKHELKFMHRSKRSKENIVCKYCKKSYNNVKWLLRHEKMHHEKLVSKEEDDCEDMFKCSCCKASFDTRDKCKTHQNSEHADMLTCQDCDKIFSNMDSLRYHKNNFHKGLPRKVYIYVCERCGHQFKQKASLVYHEENNCGTGPLVQCNICSKSFSSIHVRKSHMRVHDTEKKLLCKFCGKSFHWKGQLKIHERSHTGEKPFSCLYCPKAFAYRESLITHSSLHTGIKPHLCEACGSRFSCIGNLIKHRATHVNTCGVWYSKNKL